MRLLLCEMSGVYERGTRVNSTEFFTGYVLKFQFSDYPMRICMFFSWVAAPRLDCPMPRFPCLGSFVQGFVSGNTSARFGTTSLAEVLQNENLIEGKPLSNKT